MNHLYMVSFTCRSKIFTKLTSQKRVNERIHQHERVNPPIKHHECLMFDTVDN